MDYAAQGAVVGHWRQAQNHFAAQVMVDAQGWMVGCETVGWQGKRK